MSESPEMEYADEERETNESQFVLAVWLVRNANRFTKACLRLRGFEIARDQLADDDMYACGVMEVVKWCEARKLSVVFTRRVGGIYYTGNKKIAISATASPMHQLHYLLHECGHHLIGIKEKTQRFGMGYGNLDKRVQKTYHHKLDVLEEEFEAWHRGWKLAERLGIFSEMKNGKKNYDATRVRMLKSYVRWVADGESPP